MVRLLPFIVSIALCLPSRSAFPQALEPPAADTVRVNVTINPDQSRTTYQFDSANHKATATTTEPDGKMREKIEYKLDGIGRFESGRVFGPNGAFRCKTQYKYDTAGRMEEEVQRREDDSLMARILYRYDANGKQTGFSIFDSSGRMIGGTSTTPTPAPSKSRKKGH